MTILIALVSLALAADPVVNFCDASRWVNDECEMYSDTSEECRTAAAQARGCDAAQVVVEVAPAEETRRVASATLPRTAPPLALVVSVPPSAVPPTRVETVAAIQPPAPVPVATAEEPTVGMRVLARQAYALAGYSSAPIGADPATQWAELREEEQNRQIELLWCVADVHGQTLSGREPTTCKRGSK